MDTVTTTKPRVDLGNLLGPEGNAFCVLGRCQEAARKAGWTTEQINEFMDKAMSGDYNNVLDCAEEAFKVKMYPAGYRQ
jgi:hypothetical protein